MILVDTSVWIDHLRAGVSALRDRLDAGAVCIHPFVIGEIACGVIRERRVVLDLLGQLPSVPVALEEEVLSLIDRRTLMGRGIGYLDAHLLASALLARAPLWTHDRHLAGVAAELGVAAPTS